MEAMYAPWRNEVLDRNWDPGDCVFCTLPLGDDRERLILIRGEASYLVLNANPYNRGHLLVVLFDHTDRFDKVDLDVAAEHTHLTQIGIEVIRSVYEPDGFNIGANIGRGAGGSVQGHFHTHIIPRWENDTDFLPTTADLTVVESKVRDVYENLRSELPNYDRVSAVDLPDRELCLE